MKYSTENRNRASCWRRGALAALSLGLTASLALAPSAALAAGNSDEGTTEKTATAAAGLGASAANVATASMASVPTGRAVAAAAAAGAAFAEGAPAAEGASSGMASAEGGAAGTTPEGTSDAAGAASTPIAPAEPGTSAEGETNGAAAEEGSEETYSVTFYHSEMVFYDDPAYVPEDDPRYEGFRLMQAVTVDGFKPGDVVRAWDYVGTAKGFTFFDGWPAEIVVSEDESKNAIQLNYFRDTSDCTVNHYVIYDGNAPLPMRAGGTPLPLESLDASSIEVAKIHEETLPAQLFGEQLASEDYADVTKLTNPSNPDEQLGGMTLVGTYPSKMFVSTDVDRNELNLFYAVAAENLPDDVPVDADGPEAGDDNSGAGDGDSTGGSNGGSGSDVPGSDADNGADNDAGNGEGGAGSDTDNGAGNGGSASGSGADQGQQGDGSGNADGADNAGGTNADDATGSDGDDADSSSLKGKALPTTGDDASGVASLPLVMGCALGGALFAHRQRTRA